jgi:hypothetical protein
MEKFKYEIVNPITRIDVGFGLTAYIAPDPVAEFASGILPRIDFNYHRVAKVLLSEEYLDVFQFPEAVRIKNHEILILGLESKEETILSLWVDTGSTPILIAAFYPSENQVQMAVSYSLCNFLQRLSELEIREIFDFIIEHPESLDFKS